MTLRLLRYKVVAIGIIAIVSTCVHAGVLHLVPISEVDDSSTLSTSRDSAVWVSENDTDGECFSNNGALLDENAAALEEANHEATSESPVIPAPEPMPTGGMETCGINYTQPGDITGDGCVDEADAIVMQNNWLLGVSYGLGTILTRDMGDLNGDNRVDTDDSTIMVAHWGQSSVPEPSMAVLLLCGTLGLLIFRRGFRRILN